MYCFKCKKKTDSKDIVQVISKNNRRMLKSKCSVCGCKKSSFAKSETGKGIGDKIIETIGKMQNFIYQQTKENMLKTVHSIIYTNIRIAVRVPNMIRECKKDTMALTNWTVYVIT